MTPANQVAFVSGWRRKSQVKRAASRPLSAGKKAVPVAVLYLSATASVKSPRQRQLPRIKPLFTTSRVTRRQEQAIIITPGGTSVIIVKKVKTIGSTRPSTSFATE